MADIKQQGIRQIYCLGDIIGYGPNPRERIDLVIPCDVCLLGNHDQGCCSIRRASTPGRNGRFSGPAINWKAAAAIRTRTPAVGNSWGAAANWRENGFLFVHGSARNPLNEYVFPEDIYNHRKMEKIFSLIENHCFQGHTHVPGVFTESLNFLSPDEINYEYQLADERTMINVGSVGQPRDGDPRACYVVLDDGVGETTATELQRPCKVQFRRVEYPLDRTIQKIYDIPELDNFLGDCLREGR